MNRLLLSLCFALLILSGHAQNVDVDKKTGLVEVDGKQAFYMQKMGSETSGFSIQNLEKKEVLFVKRETVGEHYNPTTRATEPETSLRFIFSGTGNSCLAKPPIFSFNTYKVIATIIARAHLIEGNTVSTEAERTFVVSNNGDYRQPDKPAMIVNVSTPDTRPAPGAEILVRNGRIYNHDEGIGSFKRSEDAGNELIAVYDRNDQKVATARHALGNADADWNIALTADAHTVNLLYNPATPLERLFKYLYEKGLLK